MRLNSLQCSIRGERSNYYLARTVILSIVAGLCFAVVSILGSNPEAKAKIGKLPKDSVANHPLRTFEGKQFSLAGLRGQVVVLDFFAVWCGHSRDHIPTMTRFGDADRERGLQIIGLAVQDSETSSERITQFIKDLKITYPIGVIKDHVFSEYVDSRDVSVPQTLVYGRDGRLVAHFSGHDDRIDAALTETVKRELEKQ